MEITFIRHSRVLFNWRKFYNADSFELACQAYDSSPVLSGEKLEIEEQPVYISNLTRTGATAKNLLQDNVSLIKTDLLNEISLKPFIHTKLQLPTILWMVAGRLQWYFNHSNQPETRSESRERINKFLDQVLNKKQSCIIIGHGLYFTQLVSEMKKRGIVGEGRKKLKNEELRVFTC